MFSGETSGLEMPGWMATVFIFAVARQDAEFQLVGTARRNNKRTEVSEESL